jgi:hypothetical protein
MRIDMKITNKKGLLTAEALKEGYTELIVKEYKADCRTAQADIMYRYEPSSGTFSAEAKIITLYGDGRAIGEEFIATDKSIRSLREAVNTTILSGNAKTVGHEINHPLEMLFADIANRQD